MWQTTQNEVMSLAEPQDIPVLQLQCFLTLVMAVTVKPVTFTFSKMSTFLYFHPSVVLRCYN